MKAKHFFLPKELNQVSLQQTSLSEIKDCVVVSQDDMKWLRFGSFIDDMLHDLPQRQDSTGDEEVYIHDKLVVKRHGEFFRGRLVHGSSLLILPNPESEFEKIFYHGKFDMNVDHVKEYPIISDQNWKYMTPVGYELRVDRNGVYRAFPFKYNTPFLNFALEMSIENNELVGIKIIESSGEYRSTGVELIVYEDMQRAIYINKTSVSNLSYEDLQGNSSYETFLSVKHYFNKYKQLISLDLKNTFQSTLDFIHAEKLVKSQTKKEKLKHDRPLTQEQLQLIEEDILESKAREQQKTLNSKLKQEARIVEKQRNIEDKRLKQEQAQQAMRAEAEKKRLHLEATSPQRYADQLRYQQGKLKQKVASLAKDESHKYQLLMSHEKELRNNLFQQYQTQGSSLLQAEVLEKILQHPNQEDSERELIMQKSLDELDSLVKSWESSKPAENTNSLWQPNLFVGFSESTSNLNNHSHTGDDNHVLTESLKRFRTTMHKR